MVEELKQATFLKHLNTDFHLEVTSEQTLLLKLFQVVDRSKGPSEYREPFSVEFRGPAEPILEQSIYRLEHPVMGKLDIFLVPVGPNQEGMVYEAVFN